MILTIINGIMLVIMIITVVIIYNMINSFAELIVRFVELNQEHFKNQKHLVAKSNELAQTLKKVPSFTTNLKAISRKFDGSISKLENQITRLDK